MSQEFLWHFVTYEEVHALHAKAIDTYGGDGSGVRDGCVEQCVDGSKTAAMYMSDDDSDLLAAAACLLICLARITALRTETSVLRGCRWSGCWSSTTFA